LLRALAAHIDSSVVVFGLLAVTAFWFAIQLCWSAKGKQWYSVVARLAGAVALIGFGVLMVFYTAFGAEAH
jgi:MFS-type transporter involved in bile tolerance (Atg22 family)